MLNNAFYQAKKIEELGMMEVHEYVKANSYEGRVVWLEKGRLAADLQKTIGDAVFTSASGGLWALDCKVEEEDKYGNFYLETWSNKSRFTLGWMFNLNTDLIMYYFYKNKDLYTISFQNLRKWAFCSPSMVVPGGLGRLFDFPEKKQGKYTQLNDTYGRCVPISTVLEEVNGKHVSLAEFLAERSAA